MIDQDRKYQALSDEDGRFRITAIPAGEYTMQIKYHGDTMNNIAVNVPMDGIYQSGTIEFNASKMLGVINVKADDVTANVIPTVKLLITAPSGPLPSLNKGERV